MSYAQSELRNAQSDLSVYVDIDATTWKTRGRIFYDVKGSIQRKLALAGFTVIRDEHDPHDVTLSVRYREEKGAAYGVNKFGTNLRAEFSLGRSSSPGAWKLHIVEASENSVSGTPPYLDVLEKFVTNPYYFFVGELLHQYLVHGLNVDQALLVHMQKIASQSKAVPNGARAESRFTEADHAATSSNEFYLPFAMIRSIDELTRRETREAIPVLIGLSHYPNERVRARAIKALGLFDAL